jgi:hypothetical protein
MGGPQNQSPDADGAVADLAVLALKPLANLLLGQGLGINEFHRMVKWVFVQEAARRQRAETGRVNVSRLAVVTGLTRHDVAAQLRAPVKPVAVMDYDRQRSNRVLLAWHRDAEFLTPEGKPRPLPYDGDQGFVALTRKHSGDIPPRAMLTELLASRAIEQRQDGTYLPASRSIQEAGADVDRLLEIGRRLHLAAEAITGTVAGPRTPPTYQELRLAEGLDPAAALELLTALNRRSERFMELCQALLDEKVAPGAVRGAAIDAKGPAASRHRVGLFLAVLHHDDAADTSPPPTKRRRKKNP